MVGLITIDVIQGFPVSLFFVEGSGGDPLEKFENQESRRSHLRPICNAIRVLR